MSDTHTRFAWVGLGWSSSWLGAHRSPWVESMVRGVYALGWSACRPRRRRAQLNQALVRRHRQHAAPSRQHSPSLAVLDAQSIKCSERNVLDKGFDGHKKIRGRKRHLVVDTGGRLLAAHVGLAHENDRVGGKAALQKLAQQGFERLGLVLADTGYDGQPLAQWTREHCGWRLETAPGLTGSGGFTPIPTRWVVERSISWLQWDRRLSRDYECETAAAEATIFPSSIRYLIRKF